MSFGLVTGLLIPAILMNIGNVECRIKKEQAGSSFVLRSDETMSLEESFLESFGLKWDEIVKAFKGIYPGTKWCGIGSVAQNGSDFGTSIQTDMCCKKHDGCETYITAFGSNYSVRNYAPYTVSGCDCDDTFLQCMIGVAKSETIPADDKKTAYDFGRLFFNVVSPKCLKKDYPRVCVKKWLGIFCKEYQNDTSQEKVWQLVKGPNFPSKKDDL